MKKPLCICIGLTILHLFAADIHAQEPDPSNISAKAAVVIEAKSGRVLWKKQETARLPMASTTKIMTTILTLESGDLDTEFTVDPAAVHTEGSSMGLREGDIVSKRDLCIGMLLPSGNDAANCAAVRVGGNIPDFVKLMNAKAAKLGLCSTHFVTPSGLHADDHYSTALDMAILTAYALKNPDFASICSQKIMRLEYGNPPYSRSLSNTNKLLTKYAGCIGVKTGFTDEAGRCLISAAERDGVTLICVTLNAPDDWNDHIKLYDSSFTQAHLETVTEDISYDIPLAGGVRDSIRLIPQRQPMYVRIDGQTNTLTYKAVTPQLLYAPLITGSETGTLIVSDNGKEIDRIPLVTAEDAPMTSTPPPKKGITYRIREFFKTLLFAR